MPLVVADRVKETTSTAGTGTLTLAGAATGFQSFAVIGNGNQTYYTIAGQGTSEWEVGIGTYTSSGTTLSRDSVLSSSAGGAKVTFSAGTKDVFVVYPSGRAVYGDTVGNVTITTNFQAARLTAADSTSNATLLYADAYSISGASAVPMVDMSGVWNTSGSPTLLKYNVTNTASGSNSLLLDIQTTGSSRFRVDSSGSAVAAGSLTAGDSTSNVTLIYGDAYSVSGASAVPLVEMSGIWNTTGEPTLVKYNVVNTASGTNSLLLDLQTGGTSRFKVDKNGNTTAASSIFGGAVSVGSAVFPTATITTGTITNLTATNETVTSLTATAETVTSLTVTNETVGTITGTTNSFCGMDTIQGNIVIATAAPANTQIFYSDSGSISGSSAVALFDIAATWNTTGSPTGFKLNVADSASDTLSSFIDLQRNGSSQFKINKYGGANTRAILQTATITAAAPSATTNYDVITQVVQYYTTDATANFTLNFRGNSTISLASYMSVGQSVEVVLLVTNGATPYYPNAFQIDGSAVTPKWITGVAPIAGNANSVDVYTFTIVETAAATFTVFASQNKFA